MRKTLTLLTLAASVACALPAAAQNEYGIEGMGRVSTRADEAGASVSADGRLIVFASNREGGAGGWDLWQAQLEDKRWGQPTALPFNGAGDETAPHLSVDGQWLYFAVAQGRGSQLYRVARLADGWGTPQPLQAANVDGAAYSPTTDGSGRLYFLHGDGKTGPTQLWQAGADGSQPAEVTGVRGAYAGVLVLGQRGDLVLADTQAQRLWHRWCEAGHCRTDSRCRCRSTTATAAPRPRGMTTACRPSCCWPAARPHRVPAGWMSTAPPCHTHAVTAAAADVLRWQAQSPASISARCAW